MTVHQEVHGRPGAGVEDGSVAVDPVGGEQLGKRDAGPVLDNPQQIQRWRPDPDLALVRIVFQRLEVGCESLPQPERLNGHHLRAQVMNELVFDDVLISELARGAHDHEWLEQGAREPSRDPVIREVVPPVADKDHRQPPGAQIGARAEHPQERSLELLEVAKRPPRGVRIGVGANAKVRARQLAPGGTARGGTGRQLPRASAESASDDQQRHGDESVRPRRHANAMVPRTTGGSGSQVRLPACHETAAPPRCAPGTIGYA